LKCELNEELRAYVVERQEALSHSVIGLDQTGWPRLDGKTDKPWQMWCVTAPGVVCHKIRDDKGADTFRALVGGYNGVIVCDALKTHEAGARDGPDIVLAGCWAHVDRKFEEAAPDHPKRRSRLDSSASSTTSTNALPATSTVRLSSDAPNRPK
jgi:hypothetical protein